MLFRKICLMLLTGVSALCAAAEPLAIATVVDGDVVVVRQTTRLVLKAGAPLQASDLLESAANAAITRIEFSDGAVADLGPGTRVMLAPGPSTGLKSRVARLYALQGWAKVSAVPASDAGKSQVMSAPVVLSGISGSAVVSVQGKTTQVFAESGSLTVAENTAGKPAPAASLKPGSFYSRAVNEKASISPNPPSAFVATVPKSFLDPIPLRASLFKDRPQPVLKVLGELSYPQAGPWLNAEPMVRNLLVKQWQGTLSPELRKGLLDNISSHPEWRSVLLPVKTIQ